MESKAGELTQMHKQNKANLDETEFVAQHYVTSNQDFAEWAKDVQGRHALPEGWQWLWCLPKSRYFVLEAK